MRSALDSPSDLLTRLRRSIDWVVVIVAFSVITLAVINLNSAGKGDWTGRVATQLRWVGLGTIAMFVVTAIDYRVIYRGAYVAYAFGVGLLALVPLFGIKVNNARRWLGTSEWRLQPSELMKILIVLVLARYLHDTSARRTNGGLRDLAIPVAMVIVPMGFILYQPDLSTSLMIGIIAVSMFAITGLTLRRFLGLMSVAVIGFALGWSYMLNYQRKRIDVWLNPELYADDEGYQTIQAMIAVGDGGFFGRGIDKGTQNALGFLPEPFTDFPFAVYAEEWGFIGGAMLLTLYGSLILWSINIASQAKDRFGALLCVGIAALLFWQVAINVGMVLQLLPVSGITLPFISAGGSNVLTVMIALGVLMSVSRSRHAR